MIPSIDADESDFEMRSHSPGQATLFPTEDLVIPESLRTMRKSVAAIHAVPSSAERSLNLNSRRLFDGLIIVAQIDCAQRGRSFADRVRTERIAPLFEVKVTELAKICAIPGKNYQRLYECMHHLYETSFNWNIVGEDNQVIWENKARLLSSLGIGKGDKRGLIRFSMDPDMLSIVLEPHLWAKLSLQIMQGLRTAASYALYQTCWRYIDTSQKMTAALPTKTWVELLVGKSSYVKERDGKTVIDYGEFKRRVLTDAVARVNEVAALSHKIELKEHKQGNRVDRLQFKFIQKDGSLPLPLAWPTEIVDVLHFIGFNDREIKNISQAHSSEVVADGIFRLKQAEDKLNVKLVSRKSYFLGILRNIAVGENDIDHKKIEENVRHEVKQNAAEERQKRVRDGFEEHLRAKFRDWALALSDAERQELLRGFKEGALAGDAMSYSLVEKGLPKGNRSSLTLLRGWVEQKRPDLLDQVFANPEDRSLEAWMAWKLEGRDAIGMQ